MSARIRITVTVPSIILQSSLVRNEILQKMQRKTAPDLRRLFGQTVQGWVDKPDFSQKFHNGTEAVSTEVWPAGNSKGAQIYRLVNEGAPPHIITPKGSNRRGVLRFQTGYRRSTTPRVLGSRANSRYGDTVSALVVRHPGFEARAFDETIAEEYAPTFAEDMQDAIKIATVKRG